ncbi:transposase [Cellulomonas sp. zg-ZUI199]|uniref:Integrase core domain-containing protein n=1 Tax=Cellulomonas wangleii TaxID=2816956 RepID=A0ABX8D5X0_9CELL|nr:transposase [Cellulomonas wangleii]QVI62844.1 integrase core domain-containing protein [Cellulomonas wangleii]
MARHTTPATNLTEPQTQLDQWRKHYDTARPHTSLHRRTPAAAYTATAKAYPHGGAGTHERIRHDGIDTNGKLTLRIAGRAPHRHRTTPRPNPRDHARRRPRRPHRARHHRQTPTRADHLHHPRLPTPETPTGRTLRVRPVADVLRHHMAGC